ncbi:MAG: guanylate kinase [Ignavibacteriales bacterium CG_4_9_14_3_um_filter_34_10]|nr:MAG: guanylate kinase [Ignavibacteriales bacterium CG_4_9_14_3_um_filter_34_10]
MTVNKKAKLFVFSAPSGSGKTTIVRSLLKYFPELVFSVSATTRKKRSTEINGKDYFFISETEFENKIKNDEFVEWEKFYDYYYGTLVSFIEDKLGKSQSVVLEVDVKGALSIKKSYPDSVLIFIMPPSLEELKVRLLNRKTESEEDFKKRIHRAEMELSYKDKFDYIVINDNLERAKNQVLDIIKNEIN